jgi:hypothetical protein
VRAHAITGPGRSGRGRRDPVSQRRQAHRQIVSADGGTHDQSETAGEVTVDLAKVKTFSTDEPIVDWTPYKTVKLFHNVEWLPNITDWFGDYNLNADVGVRATIYEGLFAEAKIELRYDSTPAPGAKKEDVRYPLGVGWSF